MSIAHLPRVAACLLLAATGCSAAFAETADFTVDDVANSFSCEAMNRITLNDGSCSSEITADTRFENFGSKSDQAGTGRKPKATPAPVRLTMSGRTVESAVKMLPQLPGERSLEIEFDNNSVELTEKAKANARVFAQALRENPKVQSARFAIDGHTNATGTAAYNQDLSLRRAQAVVAFLVAEGVDSSRFEIAGHGFTRPLYIDNPTAPENRRVEARRLDGPLTASPAGQ
jgi:outer membrane protein OmpA-like peptidoglycan-associated protein